MALNTGLPCIGVPRHRLLHELCRVQRLIVGPFGWGVGVSHGKRPVVVPRANMNVNPLIAHGS